MSTNLYEALKTAIETMMYHLGRDGEITTRHSSVIDVMDALADINEELGVNPDSQTQHTGQN